MRTGWLGRLSRWRTVARLHLKALSRYLALDGGPHCHNGDLYWYRRGQWIRLTPEEERDHISREAW